MFRHFASSLGPRHLVLTGVSTALLAGTGAVRAQDFATFLGGASLERVMAIALDDQDRVILVGNTQSQNFPVTTGGPFRGGSEDAFVALIDPTVQGSTGLVWSQYLGGASDEVAFDVEFSAARQLITVVGQTRSPGFMPTPTAGAYQTAHSGDIDGFVVQLDLQGVVVYSTFLGTSLHDRACAVEVDDASGLVTVAGHTNSDVFPVSSAAYQQRRAGGFDVFVARLQPAFRGAAQLVSATYLGGSLDEGYFATANPRNWDALDLFVAPNGETTVAGMSWSTNFPTQNPFQGTMAGRGDMFVARLDLPLGTLGWSTYLGSSENDGPVRIAVDGRGLVTVGGVSWGPFPTTAGAPQQGWTGRNEGVLARLDPTLPGSGQLVYSTLVGGGEWDAIFGMAVEPSGIITACGMTWDTTGAWNATNGALVPGYLPQGCGFALRLDPQGLGQADVHYFTYLGVGAAQIGGREGALAMALASDGRAVLAGGTDNPAWPTSAGAPQPIFGGGPFDATLMVVDLLPSGAVRYGASSPTCRPPIYMQVNSNPAPGNGTFELHCNGAPANAFGALAIGAAFDPGLPPVFGAVPYVSPILVTVSATAGANGFARFVLPIPPGIRLNGAVGAQWFWLDPSSCGAGLAASDALRL